MPSVVCLFSLVLTSQASWAFAAQVIMRNGAEVAVSVSASAETVELAMPKMSSNENIETKVQGLLREVEDMARSGATPEPDKIKMIKDIVDGELVPDLKASRDSTAKQVGINLAAIDTCTAMH